MRTEIKDENGKVIDNIDYVEFVVAIASEPRNPLLGALGLTGESGEVAELVKKDVFHGVEYTREKMMKELGDVMWYVAYMAHTHNLTLEQIVHENVMKLKARYPNGFNPGGGIREGAGAA